jgi:hypothetical protein
MLFQPTARETAGIIKWLLRNGFGVIMPPLAKAQG